MRTPIVYSRLIFQHPFSIKGVPDIHPAGSYSIETYTRRRWSFPFSWEIKTKTIIRISIKTGLEGSLVEFEVDPRDLFQALKNDRLQGAI